MKKYIFKADITDFVYAESEEEAFTQLKKYWEESIVFHLADVVDV
jgi:hypothetical protein